MEQPYDLSKADFAGWATRNDLLCSDGRIIRHNAFLNNDGEKVPIVWNHNHNDPSEVLGHALLENRDEGVYAYGFLNDTTNGDVAKTLIKHGDIRALSIYANKLKQDGPNVIHGDIKEVSLVHAGANPGAYIETVLAHGEGSEMEGEIFTGMEFEPVISHSDGEEIKEIKKETSKMAEEKKTDEKTVQDVIDSMTEEQKNVMYALVGQALEDKEDNDQEDDDMKHNVFDNDYQEGAFLSHSDEVEIINMAKTNNVGSLQSAIELYANNNSESLAHGFESVETLFPEYHDVKPGAPEMLTTDQGWISKVLAKVHKSPMSRIRTRQADVRDISDLRAKGYTKGKQKTDGGNIKLLHRTTDPQTIYVKSKLDRDDIIDITDFDYVQYMYNVDRMNLNEEIATAILMGDGREEGTDGKIQEDKIRPIWTDDELYTIHADIDVAKMKAELQGTETSAHFGENYIYAEAVIQTLLYAREQYKGSGMPDFYCAPHLVNVMLLARDLNGRRIYDKVSDLAAALNVGEIITVEQMEGKTRTCKDTKKRKILGLMCNLSDYSLGANKGGEITHFTDFDIDFNQQKSLLETRCSGANTRVLSAIALEEVVGD